MPSEHPDLQVLGPAARQAVEAAEAEARSLGHDQVGTEHLLLGLLADAGSVAARTLGRAGATLPVVRRKVLEARPARPRSEADEATLELSARAARAVGRSLRFCRQSGGDAVAPEHLLIAVLDVEGTAGQVLRGVGFDVDGIRQALDAGDAGGMDQAGGGRRPRGAEPATRGAFSCAACGGGLAGNLEYRLVQARGEGGAIEALLFACGSCGMVTGTAPA